MAKSMEHLQLATKEAIQNSGGRACARFNSKSRCRQFKVRGEIRRDALCLEALQCDMSIPNLVFESFVASVWAKLSFVAAVWAKLQLGPHDPCRLGKAIINCWSQVGQKGYHNSQCHKALSHWALGLILKVKY